MTILRKLTETFAVKVYWREGVVKRVYIKGDRFWNSLFPFYLKPSPSSRHHLHFYQLPLTSIRSAKVVHATRHSPQMCTLGTFTTCEFLHRWLLTSITISNETHCDARSNLRIDFGYRISKKCTCYSSISSFFFLSFGSSFSRSLSRSCWSSEKPLEEPLGKSSRCVFGMTGRGVLGIIKIPHSHVSPYRCFVSLLTLPETYVFFRLIKRNTKEMRNNYFLNCSAWILHSPEGAKNSEAIKYHEIFGAIMS